MAGQQLPGIPVGTILYMPTVVYYGHPPATEAVAPRPVIMNQFFCWAEDVDGVLTIVNRFCAERRIDLIKVVAVEPARSADGIARERIINDPAYDEKKPLMVEGSYNASATN